MKVILNVVRDTFIWTLICLAALSIIVLPMLLSGSCFLFLPFEIVWIFVPILAIALPFVFYKFAAKPTNLFALPISLVIFPFLFLRYLILFRQIGDVSSCDAGWEMWAVATGMYYSLPLFIITIIVSIYYANKFKNARV